MRRINADIVIAAGLLVFSGVLFAATFAFTTPPLFYFSIRTWPRAVVGTLGVLSFLYLLRSLRAGRPQGPMAFDPRAWIVANRNVLACFGLFTLFVATLPYLGMLIGGILFVYILLALMGGGTARTHAVNAAIAVVSVGGMWAIFTFALGAILPGGIFHI